jgi:hypothetical protein
MVPVSRKRKKKNNRKARPAGHGGRPDLYERSRRELAGAFPDLVGYRRQLDERRASSAAAAAEPFVAELVAFAADRSDLDLEDALCARLGVRLAELDDGAMEDHVDPNRFVEAVIAAAASAVAAALGDAGGSDDWQAPWRVLTVVANVVPFPLSELAADAIKGQRGRPGGNRLPEPVAGPRVTDPVRWVRDGYGSRFGVAAAFATQDGPDRWYLWDIDACGHDAFTVHSGYYPTSEQALAHWRGGVGEVAAGTAAFAAVDDVALLGDLLPREQGMMRPGGENVAQFAEYHRSKRLAEAVLSAVDTSDRSPRSGEAGLGAGLDAGLDAATATTRFTAWLLARRSGQPLPDDLDEIITELADSWQIDGPTALYSACSPHRVALVVEHIRDYYQDDFAADLVALLPDWTVWLAELNKTAPGLAERCRPYAHGEPHPGVSGVGNAPQYLACVAE